MSLREISRVTGSRKIAENTFESALHAPQIASLVKAGQFINILPSGDWPKVMRRPMSVSGTEGDNLSIIYKVVGTGTEQMYSWAEGDEVDIIGPLGNYWADFSKTPIIIGGGVGIAPIFFLHNTLQSNNIEHYMIMGSRTANEHFLEHDLPSKVLMTTDDGTYGIHGNVVAAVDAIAENLDLSDTKLFVCGPAPMMEAMKDYALAKNIECDIALETVMACGIGICQGCSMEYVPKESKESSYREKYGLVCMDGPIFKAKEIKTCYL